MKEERVIKITPEIQEAMLNHQQSQGNKRDWSVFERNIAALPEDGGFNWGETEEGDEFWHNVLVGGDIGLFYEVHPDKKLNSIQSDVNKEQEEENHTNNPDLRYFCLFDKIYCGKVVDGYKRIKSSSNSGVVILYVESEDKYFVIPLEGAFKTKEELIKQMSL